MAKTLTRTVDLEPIDRLEEKVKLLVSTLEQLRAEQARLTDENARLAREREAMQERVTEAEETGPELLSLREERDVVRTRVADMLEQLESLNL